MYFTDDPVADFERYDAEQQALIDKLPKCEHCGQPIQQDDAVVIDGCFYCDKCLEDMREQIDYE